ncbi:zinc-dependent alcohol dehydrogenase family protein [Cumulibacter manganitolerans]|uniref:zinc-dependent alcohol dehydrogenase family protein n=1 Tax=Cumulibacter manganitolerans TaxID=1884992 RepID=UPI001294B9A6|nr:zinc-dependent alcohol dehydrogenase family protein [Cumulibacter manganitolerans]
MKALRYNGPGEVSWDDVPDPVLVEDTDAIVGVDTTTICGTDLHILAGDLPSVVAGRVLGHEAVGTVEAVGSAVTTITPGTRVLVSCISACARCRFCRERRYGQCLGGGGWILGNKIDGTQAEYVRVPFADTSLYPIPTVLDDEAVLMLSDILPTSYELGVVNGAVRPGDTVVVVGAGPIGLATVLTARLYSPGRVVVVDRSDARLTAARQFGADVAINPDTDDPAELVGVLTDDLGADVTIEAVGLPETFEMCARLVRPGGHLANIGVHGRPATLHLEELWSRDLTLTTGLVDTWSTPTLLRLVRSGQLPTDRLATHRFELTELTDAYDTFAHAGDNGALKVVLHK